MNRAAEEHLALAEEILVITESGDPARAGYQRAADEILAARAVDPGLTMRQIDKRLKRGADYVGKLVRWREAGMKTPTPFSHGGQSDHRKGSDRAAAKRVLREQPLEQIEHIISSLPEDRQRVIAAAVGVPSARARQEYEEQERTMTPTARKEREAAVEAVDQMAAHATAGFDAFGIANHLEQAKDILEEMIAKSTLTSDGLGQIDRALGHFLDEYKVAQATIGEEVGA